MRDRLLIALQYCPLDLGQALTLAKLMADLQRGHRGQCQVADLLLSPRFDCPMGAVFDMFYAAAPAFKVQAKKTDPFPTGWPAGPNGHVADALTFIAHQARVNRNFSAVLLMEPDDCPLRPDWIEILLREYVEAGSPDAFGCLMDPRSNPDCASPIHINGNMIIRADPELLEDVARIAHGTTRPWDVAAFPRFTTAINTSRIRNVWKAQTISDSAVHRDRQTGVAMLHGVKDNSALEASRKINLQ